MKITIDSTFGEIIDHYLQIPNLNAAAEDIIYAFGKKEAIKFALNILIALEKLDDL